MLRWVHVGLLTVLSGTALADPVLRTQMTLNGDFLLIGNTMGKECDSGAPGPTGAAVVCGAGPFGSDSSPDIFWRVDDPNPGDIAANTSLTVAQARTSAQLNLPANIEIRWARLYWAAIVDNASPT